MNRMVIGKDRPGQRDSEKLRRMLEIVAQLRWTDPRRLRTGLERPTPASAQAIGVRRLDAFEWF